MSDVIARARALLAEAPAAMAAAGERPMSPGVVPELLAEAERLRALVARADGLLRAHASTDGTGGPPTAVERWLRDAETATDGRPSV